uniref:Uncharacterized protein n=1 Tax=Romanomermis culicivorax TaxID=13658 RepID=A0A915IW54_ROMCU
MSILEKLPNQLLIELGKLKRSEEQWEMNKLLSHLSDLTAINQPSIDQNSPSVLTNNSSDPICSATTTALAHKNLQQRCQQLHMTSYQVKVPIQNPTGSVLARNQGQKCHQYLLRNG